MNSPLKHKFDLSFLSSVQFEKTLIEKILEKNCSNTDKVNRIIAIDHEKRNEEICDYVIRNNNYEEALSEIINVLGLEEKRD